MHKVLFILALLLFSKLEADPWGKDADLVNKKVQSVVTVPCQTPIMGKFAECMIGFHKTVITPIDGPRSHYLPSSSQYTLDAMRKYGYFKGFTMGCDRLMRENDDEWVYPKITDGQGYTMKSDPVK
jgi:uncharacterized protein